MNKTIKIEAVEITKMKVVQGESQVIGEFLEWLQEERLELCKIRQDVRHLQYDPDRRSIEKLLADYFEIDLDKVEEEKREILKQLEETNV